MPHDPGEVAACSALATAGVKAQCALTNVEVDDVEVVVDVDATVLVEALVLVDVDGEATVDDVLVVLEPFPCPFPNPGDANCVDNEVIPVEREVYSVFNRETLWFVVLKPVERDATPVKSWTTLVDVEKFKLDKLLLTLLKLLSTDVNEPEYAVDIEATLLFVVERPVDNDATPPNAVLIPVEADVLRPTRLLFVVESPVDNDRILLLAVDNPVERDVTPL